MNLHRVTFGNWVGFAAEENIFDAAVKVLFDLCPDWTKETCVVTTRNEDYFFTCERDGAEIVFSFEREGV